MKKIDKSKQEDNPRKLLINQQQLHNLLSAIIEEKENLKIKNNEKSSKK